MKDKPYLEAGEVICDNCNGDGKLSITLGSITVCTKCWGTGKLDWIEVCTGKMIPEHIFRIPLVRKVYPKLLAKELISVQPIEWKSESNEES